jgi:hypothetical protein
MAERFGVKPNLPTQLVARNQVNHNTIFTFDMAVSGLALK